MRRLLSWECRFFSEDDTNISEDSRRRPRTSESVRSPPKIMETETALICLSPSLTTALQLLSIWRGKYRHLHIIFISYIGLSLHIFRKFCQVKLQPPTYFNQAWEIRIWPVSVSWREIEIRRRENWQVYVLTLKCLEKSPIFRHNCFH